MIRGVVEYVNVYADVDNTGMNNSNDPEGIMFRRLC